MDAPFFRAELEDAFLLHSETIARAAETGDWEPFVQLFTADAEYVDPMVGTMRGHDEIRPWVEATLAAFPGSAMHFPESWHLIDEANGRVICELQNVLRDPGDQSVFSENNISILTYAGNGKFHGERDIYDSPSFIKLIEEWGRASHRCGSLSESERAWFAQVMPSALDGTDQL